MTETQTPTGRWALNAAVAVAAALRRLRRGSLGAYLFIAPALIMYVVFFVWPFIQLIWLSLHEWSGFGPRLFVGLDNYAALTTDRTFWLAFRHNLAWTTGAIVVPVAAGLLLAILLSRAPVRGRAAFRAIYFLPQIISSIVVAVAWGWIYNPRLGVINQVLEAVGLGAWRQAWLGERDFALPALFIAWSWIQYGFAMVIFIAALQGIDETYFEAAKIDGANAWQQLRHILLPGIAAPVTTVMLTTSIASFQVFDIIFALTNGGPGRATMVIPLYMLDSAFTFRKIGYGAAIAVTLGMFIFLFSLALLRVRGSFREGAH